MIGFTTPEYCWMYPASFWYWFDADSGGELRAGSIEIPSTWSMNPRSQISVKKSQSNPAMEGPMMNSCGVTALMLWLCELDTSLKWWPCSDQGICEIAWWNSWKPIGVLKDVKRLELVILCWVHSKCSTWCFCLHSDGLHWMQMRRTFKDEVAWNAWDTLGWHNLSKALDHHHKGD